MRAAPAKELCLHLCYASPIGKSLGRNYTAPWFQAPPKVRSAPKREEHRKRLTQQIADGQGLSMAMVEQRLRQLTTILPDLGNALVDINPAVLAALMEDPSAVAHKLHHLKQLVPGADICKVAVGYPELLLQDVAQMHAELETLRDLLGVYLPDDTELDREIERNPLLLNTELVQEAMWALGRGQRGYFFIHPALLLLTDGRQLLEGLAKTSERGEASAALSAASGVFSGL